jgi:hypothetical protein
MPVFCTAGVRSAKEFGRAKRTVATAAGRDYANDRAMNLPCKEGIMSSVQLPLFGDVSQVINPWTWYLRVFGNQPGLVNFNVDAGAADGGQLKRTLL